MKKYLFLLLVLPISTMYSQLTISSNDVEKIYTEAIDARFSGDFAKSRNLLENLKENNFTNEFVMGLLMEVYGEYLTQLAQVKDNDTLHTAYPGIRENITEIWDMFPKSSFIQNTGLKISLLVNDLELGSIMAHLVLMDDPFHVLANYTTGITYLAQYDYTGAIPFFKKVAYAPIVSGEEQFIFQSSFYLGDIYLNMDNQLEALNFYKKAMELSTTLDLMAKTAALEAYSLNYDTAISLFQNIPVIAMGDELLHTYIASLWLSENPNHRTLLNTLLSYQNNSPFTEALIQSQLGRTQKALTLLEEDTFVKNSFPGLYYSVRAKLLSRIGRSEYDTDASLGIFYHYIKQPDLAKSYLEPLDRTLDTNGSVAFTLGVIAKHDWSFTQARDYQVESLSKQKDLLTYTELIQLETGLKNFPQAEQYIAEAKEELQPNIFWEEILNVCILLAQDKFEESEEKLLSLRGHTTYTMIDPILATIYMELEQFNKAEKLSLQLYHANPYSTSAQNQLAYYYSLVAKELDKALELALLIVKEQPDDIIYLDTLAWVYTVREEYSQAQAVFDTIEKQLNNIENISSLVDIYAHLGYFYAKIGDTKKSQEFFNRGVAIDPVNSYIHKLIQQVGE